MPDYITRCASPPTSPPPPPPVSYLGLAAVVLGDRLTDHVVDVASLDAFQHRLRGDEARIGREEDLMEDVVGELGEGDHVLYALRHPQLLPDTTDISSCQPNKVSLEKATMSSTHCDILSCFLTQRASVHVNLTRRSAWRRRPCPLRTATSSAAS